MLNKGSKTGIRITGTFKNDRDGFVEYNELNNLLKDNCVFCFGEMTDTHRVITFVVTEISTEVVEKVTGIGHIKMDFIKYI